MKNIVTPLEQREFPNGFLNWTETFYLMGREIDGIKGYDEVVGRHGSTYFFSEVPEWAYEFETLNKAVEWDGDYEDKVFDFLTLKIKELCI